MLLPVRRRPAGYALQLAAVLALLGAGIGQLSGGVPRSVLLPAVDRGQTVRQLVRGVPTRT